MAGVMDETGGGCEWPGRDNIPPTPTSSALPTLLLLRTMYLREVISASEINSHTTIS